MAIIKAGTILAFAAVNGATSGLRAHSPSLKTSTSKWSLMHIGPVLSRKMNGMNLTSTVLRGGSLDLDISKTYQILITGTSGHMGNLIRRLRRVQTMDSGDTVLGGMVMAYIIGVPIALGIVLAKLGANAAVAAVFLALVWPAASLTWLGYWLAS